MTINIETVICLRIDLITKHTTRVEYYRQRGEPQTPPLLTCISVLIENAFFYYFYYYYFRILRPDTRLTFTIYGYVHLIWLHADVN